MTNFLTTFDESHKRVHNQGHRNFYARFYEIFAQSSPEIADKFHGVDMDKQRRLLEDSFRYMLKFSLDKHANDYLNSLARLHSRESLDIPPDLYDLWLDCLVETVSEFDPLFDDDVELSWRVTLAPGIEFMKFHYGR